MAGAAWRPDTNKIPVLPNELLMQVVMFTQPSDLGVFLFVCRYTNQLVSQRVYRKAIFPDAASTTDIVNFCRKYGQSLKTMKLPQGRYFPDAFFILISQLCPNLTFLQSSITPRQLAHQLIPGCPAFASFMLTHVPSRDKEAIENLDHCPIPCCSSYYVLPTTENGPMTRISHYFHHPGALRNAILPTFGSDLLSLTLNPFDTLTAPVARLIVSRCPQLRYLVAPTVKAEGLWMLLRFSPTLAAVIVGYHEEGEPVVHHHPQSMLGSNMLQQKIDEENESAVATIEHYKRVWCVHPRIIERYDPLEGLQTFKSWHIGIIPRE